MVAGKYVVRTVNLHPELPGRTVPGNVLEVSLHYSDKGKPVWSCSNQIVSEYLQSVPGQVDHYFDTIYCKNCKEEFEHEINKIEKIIHSALSVELTPQLMNKFIANLTAESSTIKANRAGIVAEDAKASQETLLRNLKQELRNLESRKIMLSDLYPESELSLMVTANKFDADMWTEELQTIGIQILNKTVEIKVAQDNYNEWFQDTVQEQV